MCRKAKVGKFLRMIYPYLMVKKDQADIILSFPKNKAGYPLTEEIYNKRFELYNKLIDVMSENVASNYGKFEVFKTIFENRYSKKSKTIISVNYHDEEDGKHMSVSKTLNAFGNRYGDRVFDRVFEMFNIIELTGNSLRR